MVSKSKSKYTCCVGKTKNGKKCRRKCKNKFCHQHKGGNKNCNSMYVDYKSVCNKVWNAECDYNSFLSDNQNKNKDAKDCAKKRMNFMNNCVTVDEWDENHLGAITKMVRKKDRCKNVISNQKNSRSKSEEVQSNRFIRTRVPLRPKTAKPINSKRFSRSGGKKK